MKIFKLNETSKYALFFIFEANANGSTTSEPEDVESYKCYQYTTSEDEMIDSEAKNREICEGHPGFIFTKGDESKAPGCYYCWCCQPV